MHNIKSYIKTFNQFCEIAEEYEFYSEKFALHYQASVEKNADIVRMVLLVFCVEILLARPLDKGSIGFNTNW